MDAIYVHIRTEKGQIQHLFDHTPQLLFLFYCSFLCSLYSSAAFILLESLHTSMTAEKVHMSNTARPRAKEPFALMGRQLNS